MVHESGGGTGHEYYTVLGCGCASGQRLPLFILYKGKNIYRRWTTGGPAGNVYGVSESGWWFDRMFIPSVKLILSTGPVVLFVDGHHSHISVDLIMKARKTGIHIFCLPPHTTHILQPQDVGVYGPLKTAWRTILREQRIESQAAEITKEHFPSKCY